MSDVFISYSRKNSDFVHKLDDALTAQKRDVWVDWQSIAHGEDWWHSIQTGVDSTDTALIVITENWLVSEVCHRELEYIRQQNKRVFPIIREKIEGDLAIRVKGTWVDQDWEQRARDNWKYLRSVNWLYFDDDTLFDTAIKDLLTALDTDQVYVKGHTRYLVRAIEWQQSKRDPSFLLEGDQLEAAQAWLKTSINKTPEPLPTHHEYVTASDVAEKARIARDKTREELIKRSRNWVFGLLGMVVIALIAVAYVGQRYADARTEVTSAAATLQQVNILVTAAINEQVTAAAKVEVAEALVATATIEQGNAVAAQRTSAAREALASTQVAVAGSTLSPVPPTLTAVASAISYANIQNDISSRFADASLQMSDKQNALAQQIVDNIVDDYPDQPMAYIFRGLILDSNKRLDEALNDYSRAIQLDPQNELAYYNRGVIYDEKADSDHAIADYTRALALDSTDWRAYHNRATNYASQGKMDKAIVDYTQVIAINPQFTEAYNDRGLAYFQQGKIDQAIADYTQAIEIDPATSDAYYNRGMAYANQDKIDQAIADFTAVIKLKPDDVETYTLRAKAYFAAGNMDAAAADFTQVISLNPKSSDAYENRGLIYTSQNKLDDALNDFTKAIEIDPTYTDAYYDRGNVYLGQGDLDKAFANYDSAIKIDPTFALPYTNRAYIYNKQGKQAEALADYWQWIQLSESNPTTADALKQGTTPFNTTVTMTAGAIYHLPFEAKDGQLLQAQAVAAEGAQVDPLLLVLDPQGKPITYNDDRADGDSNSAISDYALPADGTYTLILAYIGNNSEGDIKLTFDLTSTASATPTPQ